MSESNPDNDGFWNNDSDSDGSEKEEGSSLDCIAQMLIERQPEINCPQTFCNLQFDECVKKCDSPPSEEKCESKCGGKYEICVEQWKKEEISTKEEEEEKEEKEEFIHVENAIAQKLFIPSNISQIKWRNRGLKYNLLEYSRNDRVKVYHPFKGSDYPNRSGYWFGENIKTKKLGYFVIKNFIVEEGVLTKKEVQEREIAKFPANADYKAKQSNELSFKKGDTIIILKHKEVNYPDSDWWFGKLRGKTGFIKKTFLLEIGEEIEEEGEEEEEEGEEEKEEFVEEERKKEKKKRKFRFFPKFGRKKKTKEEELQELQRFSKFLFNTVARSERETYQKQYDIGVGFLRDSYEEKNFRKKKDLIRASAVILGYSINQITNEITKGTELTEEIRRELHDIYVAFIRAKSELGSSDTLDEKFLKGLELPETSFLHIERALALPKISPIVEKNSLTGVKIEQELKEIKRVDKNFRVKIQEATSEYRRQKMLTFKKNYGKERVPKEMEIHNEKYIVLNKWPNEELSKKSKVALGDYQESDSAYRNTMLSILKKFYIGVGDFYENIPQFNLIDSNYAID